MQATAPCGAKRVFTKGRGWNMLSSLWIITWTRDCKDKDENCSSTKLQSQPPAQQEGERMAVI